MKMRHTFKDTSGLTLLEVMISVFLGAAILTAAVTFVFSMGQLWGRGADEKLFHKHVRGVSRFLEESFYRSGTKVSAADAEENNGQTGPVYWSSRGGPQYETSEYLTFELDESPGVFVWPEERLPYVVCSLELDEDEGLYVLWRSRLETDFMEDEPRRTRLSPFVKEILYHYIDYTEEDPEWEVLEEPEDEGGFPHVPQRIELVFQYGEERVSRQIVIPGNFQVPPKPPTQDLPL
ncbi:MAG: hypothetical protein AAGB46_13905, partial [Verrucomicrobiota bacterium]